MVNLALEDEYSYYFVDNQYIGSALIPTGKDYSFVQNGEIVTYPEYYYGGKKYIRVVASCNEKVIVSNANTIRNGEVVWVEVSPIKWFVDYKDEKFISKFVLLSGLYPDLRMFDFFSKYMKDDMFTKTLTKERMLSMLCSKFNTLSQEEQIEFIESMPNGLDNLDELSYEELKTILDKISFKDYGYSRTLKEFYF
jgi:hypothetical protein